MMPMVESDPITQNVESVDWWLGAFSPTEIKSPVYVAACSLKAKFLKWRTNRNRAPPFPSSTTSAAAPTL